MFEVRSAEPADSDQALSALVEAFARDPLMLYLFAENPPGIRAGTAAFFGTLLGARLALGMPALILTQDGDIVGAAMGYDTTRPEWPPVFTARWQALERDIPGFADRVAAYEKICSPHEPAEDHYYLGVIGVHPSAQGKGAGKALLDAFCAQSRTDGRSRGVYLETASQGSLQFYLANGFTVRGAGRLGAAPLWCLYRPAAN